MVSTTRKILRNQADASGYKIIGELLTSSLKADVPILLFPVRIETRYVRASNQNVDLDIRVYPSQIMISSSSGNNGVPVAQCLPDRWHVVLYPTQSGDASQTGSAASEPSDITPIPFDNPVRKDPSHPLAVGPNPKNIPTYWSQNLTYPAGAFVSYGEILYQSNIDNNTDQPPSPNWTAITAWPNGSPYGNGSLASYNGIVCQSNIDNNTDQPTSPNWTRITSVMADSSGKPTDPSVPMIDPDMMWLIDFEEAYNAGMATKIENASTDGYDRIIVFGLQESQNGDTTAAQEQLQQLLLDHKNSDGLAFVRQGSPTKNTPDASSSYNRKLDKKISQTAQIEINPTTGDQNTTVNVTGSSFAPNSLISIYYNSQPVETSPKSITTDQFGDFGQSGNSVSFELPSSSRNANTVKAIDSSGKTASGQSTINVTSGPLSVSIFGPSYASAGRVVHISSLSMGGTGRYTYQWTLQPPAGTNSSSSITDSTAANPSFTPDVEGTYQISLNLSDGKNSIGAEVSVTVPPHIQESFSVSITAPISMSIGQVVNLDSLPTGGTEPYVYQWSLQSPPNSSSNISNSANSSVSFTPDLPGIYQIGLIAVDSTGNSAYAQATVTAVARPFYVSITAPSSAIPGETVTLNSAPAGGRAPYTYQWSLQSPANSTAQLSDYATASPSLTPDVAGSYQVELTVMDSSGNSASAIFISPQLKDIPNCNALVTSNALGISIDTFENIDNAELQEQQNAEDMATALWTATLGYFWRGIIVPWMITMDQLSSFRDNFFIPYVRARGPLPAIRVGNVPFGILPVTSLDRLLVPDSSAFGSLGGDMSFLTGFVGSLNAAKKNIWLPSTSIAPQINSEPTDVGKQLAGILRMDASALRYGIRHVLGQDYVTNLQNWINNDLQGSYWSQFGEGIDNSIQEFLNRLNLPWNASEIHWYTVDPTSYQVNLPYIQSGPLSETEPLEGTVLPPNDPSNGNYIQRLANGGLDPSLPNYILLDTATPMVSKRPAMTGINYSGIESIEPIHNPLLYKLLQFSLLRELRYELDDGQNKSPSQQNPIAQGQIGESELVGFNATEPSETPIPPDLASSKMIIDYLDNLGLQYRIDLFSKNMYASLNRLALLPTAELDRLLGETLDICSHRLDAWITAVATCLLENQADTSNGVYLGAFGWVENLTMEPTSIITVDLNSQQPNQQDPQQYARQAAMANLLNLWKSKYNLNKGPITLSVNEDSQGYIHAPSISQAITGAILRNGSVLHQQNNQTSDQAQDKPQPFSINLTSDRARSALYLLEGIKQGQSLGGLLGSRFEAYLWDNSIQQYIQFFRNKYPLATNKITASTNTQAQAGGAPTGTFNVVDGLGMLNDWKSQSRKDTILSWLQGLLPPSSDGDLQTLESAVRFIDDMSSSLADLVTAEAVYQTVKGNPEKTGATLDTSSRGNYPPQPQVLDTPRGGVNVVHRLLTLLTYPSENTGNNPRSGAEPSLAQWVGGLLPDPNNVICIINYSIPLVIRATSSPLSVSITAPLSVSITAPLSVTVGQTVNLNSSPAGGTGSYTYQWTPLQIPPTSQLTLTAPSNQNIAIVPDVAGSYQFMLTVTDSDQNTATAQIAIVTSSSLSVSITAPLSVSITGPSSVSVGTLVNLNSLPVGGSGQYAYQWVLQPPSTSNAKLSDPNSPTPSFTPDVAGDYQLGLTVTDSNGNTTDLQLTVSQSNLELASLDILAMADTPIDQISELAQRVWLFVGQNAQEFFSLSTDYSYLPLFNSDPKKIFQHDKRFSSTSKTFPEVLAVAKAIRDLINASRPLEPRDLYDPTNDYTNTADAAAYDTDDLSCRTLNLYNAFLAQTTQPTSEYPTTLAGDIATLQGKIADLNSGMASMQDVCCSLNSLLQDLQTCSQFGIQGSFPGTRGGIDPRIFILVTKIGSSTNSYPIDTDLSRTITDAANSFLLQAQQVLKLMQKRLAQIQSVFPSGDSTIVNPNIDVLISVIQTLLGRSFVVLPKFIPACAGISTGMFDANLTKSRDGNDLAALSRWMQQLTYVRPAVSRLDNVLVLAQVLAGTAKNFQIGQLPAPWASGITYAKSDYVVYNGIFYKSGIDNNTSTPPSNWTSVSSVTSKPVWAGIAGFNDMPQFPAPPTTSIVALVPNVFSDATQPICGLLIDEWTETIPNPKETTGLAFHYENPPARAPQSLLLAVCPTNDTYWDPNVLVSILSETLDLAKIRTVDPDTLQKGYTLQLEDKKQGIPMLQWYPAGKTLSKENSWPAPPPPDQGRIFWTAGNFTDSGSSQILFYYPVDGSWWLGTIDSSGNLTWPSTAASNIMDITQPTGEFGNPGDLLGAGSIFLIDDFQSINRSQILFYYPVDGKWRLGNFDSNGTLNWMTFAQPPTSGSLWPPLMPVGEGCWSGDFTGKGYSQILLRYPNDGSWWLGTIDSNNNLTWYQSLPPSSDGPWPPMPTTGAIFWATGDFIDSGSSQILFYYPDDGHWWLGTFDSSGNLTWPQNPAASTGGVTDSEGTFGNKTGDLIGNWGAVFLTGNFTGSSSFQILAYFPDGIGSWWLGTFDNNGILTWNSVTQQSPVTMRALFWTGDFTGIGWSQVLAYNPDGSGSWSLGTFDNNGNLTWTLVGTTVINGIKSGCNYPTGPNIWMADFKGIGRFQILVYFPADGNWWLGTFNDPSMIGQFLPMVYLPYNPSGASISVDIPRGQPIEPGGPF